MKIKFAKIFELENHQVVITKEFGDQDTYEICQRTDLEDCSPQITIGFETEQERDEAFERYNIAFAKLFLADVMAIFGGE